MDGLECRVSAGQTDGLMTGSSGADDDDGGGVGNKTNPLAHPSIQTIQSVRLVHNTGHNGQTGDGSKYLAREQDEEEYFVLIMSLPGFLFWEPTQLLLL